MASYNNEAKTAESPVGEATGGRRLISFVLPVYDEETTLRELHGQITAVMNRLPDDFEMLFVDDGSKDKSFAVLNELHREDPKVRVVQLRRNFGKAAAYSAGFDNARGDIVITMDTDLQDVNATAAAVLKISTAS